MIYSTKTNQSEEDSLLVTVFSQCCTHKVCSVTCCTFQSVQSSPGTLARCWSCRACGCHLIQTTHRDTVADRVHPLMATALCNQWPPHQDNDPTKTGMQQKDQKAQSVDLTAKEFNLTDLRHVRSGLIDGGLRCPKDPLLQDSLLDGTHPLSLHLHLVFFFCLFESQSRIGLLAGPNFNPKASANHLFLQIGCLNCSLICKLFLCLMSTFLLVAET